MCQNEAETRAKLIDKQLEIAGWNVADPTQVVQEFDIILGNKNKVADPANPYSGHQFSDYVLLGKDGKPLAVVEAKKTNKDAALGREQAKQYCLNIQNQLNCELPFCFYTNGLETYFWDLGNYPPRKVVGFPTLQDLERFRFIRANSKNLSDEFINTKIAGRDYQIKAIRSVLEAVEKKKRDFLLVMATGTGKTRTCIALIDALMRARRVEKVLFLVDRIALRQQALDAFKEHLPNEPRWPKRGEKNLSKDRRIYVSTYPTMINIIRDKENTISPHFFDLVVIDESHRSIYNTYGEILDYFKAINLGLTATPTDVIDHNTFELFHCEDGLPTFAYTYKEAIDNNPPYLCDFQVLKIRTKFQLEGINKRTISLEDQKKLIHEGKDIEEINFEGTQLEKQVINKGTNSLIVKEFMEECLKDSNGVLPGKTIFFCSTKKHARRIEAIFDGLYPEYHGELAKVMVSDDPRVYGKGGLLDQFKKSNFPRIAISVDMLDTGIDIREVVNLVFAKPVYSYTKFWQMIGRGTRLLEPADLKPWCHQKDLFLIMDCWDNFEFFKLKPKGKDVKPQLPLPVRFAGVRIDKIEKAVELGADKILEKEIGKLKGQIDCLPKSSVIIKEASTSLHAIEEANFWFKLNPEKLSFLRSEIKPLFRCFSEADFKAMRFEKDLLQASLVKLSNDEKQFKIHEAAIIEQINQLPLSVSIVNKEKELIVKAQQKKFWASITDSDFDLLAEKLAPLMKFRSNGGENEKPVFLNLEDELKKKEIVEFGPENEAVSIQKYREMVEKLIAELTEKNPTLKKIKEGYDISAAEAEELAAILSNERPHVTHDLLAQVYQNSKATLVQFVKHILGIEILKSFPELVTDAFASFIKQHSDLNLRQLEFLGLLKNFIIERQRISKKDLISSPFTVIHPMGIRGIFGPTEIDEILEMTERLAA